MNIDKFTIGADPEVFLKRINSEELVSVEGLVGGTKDHPLPITEEGHALQEDNVTAEYTIPPCRTVEELQKNINFVKTYLNNMLLPLQLELSDKASAYLNKKYLKTKQALTFGCDPDFNVYTRSINTAPEQKSLIRTAGGHIHVGYDEIIEPTLEVSEKIIKMMDLLLGVQSILLDPDKERRILYGKAGSFRIKDYGLEYRTLSNFWTFSNAKMEWAFTNTKLALNIALNKPELLENVEKHEAEIVKCINNSDEELAKVLIKELVEPLYLLKFNN